MNATFVLHQFGIKMTLILFRQHFNPDQFHWQRCISLGFFAFAFGVWYRQCIHWSRKTFVSHIYWFDVSFLLSVDVLINFKLTFLFQIYLYNVLNFSGPQRCFVIITTFRAWWSDVLTNAKMIWMKWKNLSNHQISKICQIAKGFDATSIVTGSKLGSWSRTALKWIQRNFWSLWTKWLKRIRKNSWHWWKVAENVSLNLKIQWRLVTKQCFVLKQTVMR